MAWMYTRRGENWHVPILAASGVVAHSTTMPPDARDEEKRGHMPFASGLCARCRSGSARQGRASSEPRRDRPAGRRPETPEAAPKGRLHVLFLRMCHTLITSFPRT